MALNYNPSLASPYALAQALQQRDVPQDVPQPPDEAYTGPDASAIEYQKLLAKALREKANKSIDPNRTAGGFVIPINPLEGLSKLGQGWLAGQQEKKALASAKGYKDAMHKAMVGALRGDKGAMEMLARDESYGPVVFKNSLDETAADKKALAAQALEDWKEKNRPKTRQTQVEGDFDVTSVDGVESHRTKRVAHPNTVLRMENGGGASPYFTVVQTNQGLMKFDARTGQISPLPNAGNSTLINPKDDPSIRGAVAEATAAGSEVGESQGKKTIAAINAPERERLYGMAEDYLKTATGSGIGTLADKGAAAFGVSNKGAESGDQLKILAGTLTLQVPRMEGPQSNLDQQLYREIAGQLGDSTLPTERRMAGIATLRELDKKYAHLNKAAAPTAGVVKWIKDASGKAVRAP